MSFSTLDLLTLIAILRLDDVAYGVVIHEQIEESAGRSVSMAGVYNSLDRLQRQGVVRTWQSEPRAERGGRARATVRVDRRRSRSRQARARSGPAHVARALAVAGGSQAMSPPSPDRRASARQAPRTARQLVGWLAPPAIRDALLEDLDDAWSRRLFTNGRGRASISVLVAGPARHRPARTHAPWRRR